MIYLYVKSHNVTGLKYFGKTIQNPFKYKGSGKHWVRHIKKHGYDVTTEIVGQFETEEEAKEFALSFSKENDIVESNSWANLKEENGLDGSPVGVKFSEEHKKNISASMLGKCYNDFDEYTRKKMSESAKRREIEKVNNGTCLFAGDMGSKFASERNKKLLQEGRHNFLHSGKQVSERIRKRIEEGTYHALGKLLCVDKSGNKVYIETVRYKEQIGPLEDREYVHVSSNEAKRRKHTAMKGNTND